jgi:membrane associated rhomboid family serine protease
LFLSNEKFVEHVFNNFSMTPADILEGKNLHTIFTSMFLHSGILHIAGNMLFLYVFGDNVEDAFGHGKYTIFYFLCGIAAAATHILSLLINPPTFLPTTSDALTTSVVGASGAISGVLGAYLVLYPKARVLTLVIFFWIYLLPIPAVLFLGFWFVMQWLYAVFNIGGNVAYWAHIGGFIAGMIMTPILKKRKRKPQFL